MPRQRQRANFLSRVFSLFGRCTSVFTFFWRRDAKKKTLNVPQDVAGKVELPMSSAAAELSKGAGAAERPLPSGVRLLEAAVDACHSQRLYGPFLLPDSGLSRNHAKNLKKKLRQRSEFLLWDKRGRPEYLAPVERDLDWLNKPHAKPSASRVALCPVTGMYVDAGDRFVRMVADYMGLPYNQPGKKLKTENKKETLKNKSKKKSQKKQTVEKAPVPQKVALPLLVNEAALKLLAKHKAVTKWLELEHCVKIRLPHGEAAPISVSGLPVDAQAAVEHLEMYIKKQANPKPAKVPRKEPRKPKMVN
ncbi:uncharacterized protein LOC122261812 [Penaeus japonicus]|uniref:uncharacterized protein LOC122261812 n=1 Tax=Penaeus japonicus TaxID=27405 RepID=UPI001C7158AF|nr:uncharacterized protein LOC122261812 [Penaeus japonicus]